MPGFKVVIKACEWNRRLPELAAQDTPDLRHARRLIALTTMQNTLAGMKPSWSVLNPIMQMSTPLTPATAQPSQHRRPTRIVDATVSMQDR
ncbi:MAG: hypothetical protein WBP91_07230 [Terriglobales bacterium]